MRIDLKIGASRRVWLADRQNQIVADPHVGSFSLFFSALPQHRSAPPIGGPPAVSRIYSVDVL